MFNTEFYPTPQSLAQKIAFMVDIKEVSSILEPSAGKADLLTPLAERMHHRNNRYGDKDDFVGLDIDTIEIEPDLQHILKGRGLRVVHDDFLSFNTYKQYDLIVMNPPFSQGAKHLLKALKMQRNGGQIACILNAETLKNPCNNERKELQALLTECRAKVEFIPDAFRDAERRTPVEIALIYVNIDKAEPVSNIFENLRAAKETTTDETDSPKYATLVDNDYIKAAVQQFKFEVRAGIKLIEEYDAMKPFILDRFKKPGESHDYSKPILFLNIDTGDRYDKLATINSYIRKVRAKYWEALLNNEQFVGLLTTNLREQYHSRIKELSDYDFTLYNIYTIREEMARNMVQGVEDTILKLFDDFSYQYSCEKEGNIHYYNGWKTNKAWKVNKKIVQTLRAFDIGNYGGSHWCNYRPTTWNITQRLADIDKVFNYLDGGLTESVDLQSTLSRAEKNGDTKKIVCKYFYLTFYKKGTCHIEFRNLELLEKFNIFGSQKKGWLPPSYGKKAYKDMTAEERATVDDFQGEKAYKNTMQNPSYYLFDAQSVLQLESSNQATA